MHSRFTSVVDSPLMVGTRGSRALVLAMTIVWLTVGAGCGGASDEVSTQGANTGEVGAASCAFVVEHDGHRYFGNTARIGPVEGRPLGTAIQPGCQDTVNEPVPADNKIEISEIEGVPPELAIMIQGGEDTILVRDDVDYARLPPEVTRLLNGTSCDSGGQPVQISGNWLGILGADGNTELDLNPPYDVRIRVNEASLAAYERAELTIRVPPSLGRPLTRRDIESSLWEGGTLKATVTCNDGEFVASSIEAAPPN